MPEGKTELRARVSVAEKLEEEGLGREAVPGCASAGVAEDEVRLTVDMPRGAKAVGQSMNVSCQ